MKKTEDIMLIAKYLGSWSEEDGTEISQKFFFFDFIRNHKGEIIKGTTKAKSRATHLFMYAEADMKKNRDYKLSLDKRWAPIYTRGSFQRLRDVICIECSEFQFYKEGGKFYKKDKITMSIEELSYYRGMRHG